MEERGAAKARADLCRHQRIMAAPSVRRRHWRTRVDDERKIGALTAAGVCLKQQPVFPFSPLAFPASLQTSIFQARNRTAGATMSNFRQSDVKNHLSPRFRTKIHLSQPESQPDATGFSGAELEITKENQATFSKDFTAEHSSIATPVASADLLTDPNRPQSSLVSKCAQA
jgi:hypothetical protein